MSLPEDHEHARADLRVLRPRRRRGRLGELPADLRRERGEVFARPASVGVPGVTVPRPIDVETSSRALEQAADVPLGSTPSRHLIQSTFDARPINANDWQAHLSVFLQPNYDPAVLTDTAQFVVPDARVAILRRMRWFSSDYLFINRQLNTLYYGEASPTFIELSVQSRVQTTYTSGQLQAQEGDLPVYAIANEGEVIQVRGTSDDLGDGIPSDWEVRVFFILSGNLLVNTGKETQYEPSNVQLEDGMLR